MSRRMLGRSGRIRSREQNIILLVLAVVIVALLWNFIGVIFRLALFAVVVYLVYRLLQSRV
jgi:Flp pilus assembly protein TadB